MHTPLCLGDNEGDCVQADVCGGEGRVLDVGVVLLHTGVAARADHEHAAHAEAGGTYVMFTTILFSF